MYSINRLSFVTGSVYYESGIEHSLRTPHKVEVTFDRLSNSFSRTTLLHVISKQTKMLQKTGSTVCL